MASKRRGNTFFQHSIKIQRFQIVEASSVVHQLNGFYSSLTIRQNTSENETYLDRHSRLKFLKSPREYILYGFFQRSRVIG